MYDLTSLDTFNQLAKWIGYVQTHATADVSLMLVASKSDLEGKREVTRDDGTKVIVVVKLLYAIRALISVCPESRHPVLL